MVNASLECFPNTEHPQAQRLQRDAERLGHLLPCEDPRARLAVVIAKQRPPLLGRQLAQASPEAGHPAVFVLLLIPAYQWIAAEGRGDVFIQLDMTFSAESFARDVPGDAEDEGVDAGRHRDTGGEAPRHALERIIGAGLSVPAAPPFEEFHEAASHLGVRLGGAIPIVVQQSKQFVEPAAG